MQDHIREEVFVREALALGLDRDDIIIRQRLRQKMEFLSDDVATQPQPTDVELEAYLAAHADAFRQERRFTFSQVFLDPNRHGQNLARDAGQLLAQLNQAGARPDPAALGDPIPMEHHFEGMPADDVARQFGGSFAAALGGVAPGPWQGPVVSAYGMHLVSVSERTEGRLPALEEVRGAVRRAWNNSRRLEATEAFYRELLKHYTVTIESPAPEGGKEVAGTR